MRGVLVILTLFLAVLAAAAQTEEDNDVALIEAQIQKMWAKSGAKAHARGLQMLDESSRRARSLSDAEASTGNRGRNREGGESQESGDDDNLPCIDGGSDCSDYEADDDCNSYKCITRLKRCSPRPKKGALCTTFSYFPKECNRGPGICKILRGPNIGEISVCFGLPEPGGSCDDENECTKDDKCKVARQGFHSVGICEGTFQEGKKCNDDNPCTKKDRCTVKQIKKQPKEIVCKGTPTPGKGCDDGEDCTENDVCKEDYYYDYGEIAFCEGTPIKGVECEDQEYDKY